jgi:hypothetical protein
MLQVLYNQNCIYEVVEMGVAKTALRESLYGNLMLLATT